MPVIVWVMIGLGVVVGIWMAVTLLSTSDSESDGTFPTLGIDLSGGAGDSQISANQTLTGTGDGSTTSFRLSGDYSVSLNAGGDCYYAFDLERTDGERGEDLGSITDPGSTSTQLYNLPATTYYVDVITGPSPSCPWTVTISG